MGNKRVAQAGTKVAKPHMKTSVIVETLDKKTVKKSLKEKEAKKQVEESSSSEESSEESDSESSESDSDDSTSSSGSSSAASDSSSESGSASSTESESESLSDKDEETVKAPVEASDEGSDSESDTDSESSEEMVVEKQKVDPVKTDSADESDDDSDSSESDEASGSEDSEASESESEESEAAPQPESRKRKAEEISEAKENKKPNNSVESGPVSVRLSNLPWSITNESLAAYVAEIGVTPSNVRLILDRETGRSKGFGFADLESNADAQKVIEAFNEQDLEGRPCRAEIATGSVPQRSNPNSGKSYNNDKPKGEPSSTLFVGNLSFNSNEDSLYSAFGDHGKVIGVRIPTDKESGRMKGFAYVEFSSVEDAQNALKSMDGAPVDGRAVRLDFAGARSNDGGGAGAGGFRGGSRGGGRGNGFRGGRGGSRGGPRGGGRGGRGGAQRVGTAAKGSIQQFSGQKMTFDD